MSLKTPFSSKIATFCLVAVLSATLQLAVSQDDSSKTAESKTQTTNPASSQESTKTDVQANEPTPTAGAAEAGEKADSPATATVETVGFKEEWFDNKNWFENTDDKLNSVFDPIDQSFGDIVVKPVESIFFYDVYYFDNNEAKMFATVSDLKKAIADAQAELKKARKELGLPVKEPEKEAAEKPDAEAEKEEANKKTEDKKKKKVNLTDLRNSLKGKIRDAIKAILSSKIPNDEIKEAIIGIKKPFFELDFAIRQTEGMVLTKDQLKIAVEAITKPIESLSKFETLSKKELAWALCGDKALVGNADHISTAERIAYFRGFGVKETDKKVSNFEESSKFGVTLTSLIDTKKLVDENGFYQIAKVTDGKGKEVDASYAAIGIPFIVLWLVLGAIFFTIRMTFINIRGFTHAIAVTKGDYDDPNDPGEISHFQALSSALSATVGLGNIAGVALAVSLGGPGALVWMIAAGFLGMTSKFTECTLGQMYRKVDVNGQVLGGPMRYLSAGLAEMKLGFLGKLLAVMFVVLCIGGSFGGGNMFQANQSYAAIKNAVPWFEGKDWLYGIMLAFMVGLVILGGIKRIGTAAGIIVPFMCLIYVIAGLFVLIVNINAIPGAIGTMFAGAFSMKAGLGGLVGTLVVGFQRAAFSNEAGTGSASIAHSAAATDEPVREGIVALLEPFIDTIVVCTMTGLVVVVTGAYTDGSDGVVMTSNAFASVISWFPYVLSAAVVLFAFSTMISWSYYGERCATWLFGPAASVPYKIVFLIFVFLGSVLNLGNVLGFSDLMILGMAFPNILGLLLLSGKVRKSLTEYWSKLESGEFRKHNE